MKLLTKEIIKKTPALYETESIKTGKKIMTARFFDPCGSWTWYLCELGEENLAFGYVIGHEREWGYFSIEELSEYKGKLGLGIERDLSFKATKFEDLKIY